MWVSSSCPDLNISERRFCLRLRYVRQTANILGMMAARDRIESKLEKAFGGVVDGVHRRRTQTRWPQCPCSQAGVAGVSGEGADSGSSLVSSGEETRVHAIAGKDRGIVDVEGSHHRSGGELDLKSKNN